MSKITPREGVILNAPMYKIMDERNFKGAKEEEEIPLRTKVFPRVGML